MSQASHNLIEGFKYVIRQAISNGDDKRAQAAREAAYLHHDIDLMDYLTEESSD